MMTLFLVLLKNREPVLVSIDTSELEKSKERKELIASKIDNITCSDIININCLCDRCQNQIISEMIEMCETFSSMFPNMNTMLRILPTIPDNNPLKEHWDSVQHLAMGIATLQKHFKAFSDTVEKINH